MHQLVKRLQLVISFPLIHASAESSQAPTGIRTRVPRLRGERLNLPPPWIVIISSEDQLKKWSYKYPEITSHLFQNIYFQDFE